MDGSFLSSEQVIDASRNFVCVRLATYENKEEAKVLTSIFTGRSGELENTTFALLSPDGQTRLKRAGRSPSQIFTSGAEFQSVEMAISMDEIAKRFPLNSEIKIEEAALPWLGDLRVGLNVSSCDSLPMVVVAGSNEQIKAAEQRLKSTIWSRDLASQFGFAKESKLTELKKFVATDAKPGIYVIEPNQFGTSAKLISRLDIDADATTVEANLKNALKSFDAPVKDWARHVRAGRLNEIHWDTLMPVTDPGRPPSRGGR